MSIFFKVLRTGADQGLKCDICHQGPEKIALQNMRISFADGEAAQGSVEVSVHFSCLVEQANAARARHIRDQRAKNE